MYNFIKIACTSDLNWLTISGIATETELTNAWNSVQEEFCTIYSTEKMKTLLNLQIEASFLRNKVFIIQTLVDLLSTGYDPEFIGLLRQEGFRFAYTEETLERDLKGTVTQAKGYAVRIKNAEAQLADLKTNKPILESDYMAEVATISKHQGYRIDTRQTSVLEYYTTLRNFLNEQPTNLD